MHRDVRGDGGSTRISWTTHCHIVQDKTRYPEPLDLPGVRVYSKDRVASYVSRETDVCFVRKQRHNFWERADSFSESLRAFAMILKENSIGRLTTLIIIYM